jgi:cyanophycin synthetase
MKILNIRTIPGPNIYTRRPVLVMKLDLEGLASSSSADLPGFTERLVATLPGLSTHTCS